MRLEQLGPSSTIIYLPFSYLKAMSKPSRTIDPVINMTDSSHRRLSEETVQEKAALQRQLQLALSSLFLGLLQSTEAELTRCKDYQCKKTLLRELVTDLEEFKPGMRQMFGEDSIEYTHLLLEQTLVSIRLTDVIILRLLSSELFWLVILSPFLLWFLFW
ncbi:hypothetical protein IW262DRAFT_8160 [Armillaria fumosa]|nr:hypothetical protein IW262DRAFT_8160 [Armillaria fumosa]